jgi:signal peptidase I
MEDTLYENDKILIDKTAYGIRLPITVLSIPFTFDNIGGFKSYSSLLQLPYIRLFASQVQQNDIVLFNNPTETDKPLDKRELLLCRCVALPDDMIEMKQGSFFVNSKLYEPSPNSINEYWTQYKQVDELKSIAEDSDISIKDTRQAGDTVFLGLDKYNSFLLNEYLPDSLSLSLKADTTVNYQFSIPSKGKTIELNEQNIAIYGQVILQESINKDIRIERGKLVIEGVEQKSYTFQDDYYWLASDNNINSTDSYTLGFIPFSSVIGKVRSIWYNPGKELRTDRCFKQVK